MNAKTRASELSVSENWPLFFAPTRFIFAARARNPGRESYSSFLAHDDDDVDVDVVDDLLARGARLRLDWKEREREPASSWKCVN